MVLFNHSTRELTAKIVYYGPGLCGKTTNLRLLHEKLDPKTMGRLLSLTTAQDRTIYFDLLPVELGNVKGYTVRFQLCTVPGQVFYNETRKLVLKGVDGIVFVVDSQWSMLSHNLESFQNLRENMAELGQNLDETAVVIQYNKRDLPGVLSVQALQESLGFQEFPFVESVAADAKGVVETFKLVSKLTFVQLLKRLQRSPDGDRLGPDWVAPTPPNSQATARIPAVGAELFALTSTVGPAPTPPTDSPFDTTGSWPDLAKGEVFEDPAAPALPEEAPGLHDDESSPWGRPPDEEEEARPGPSVPEPAPEAVPEATPEAEPATGPMPALGPMPGPEPEPEPELEPEPEPEPEPAPEPPAPEPVAAPVEPPPPPPVPAPEPPPPPPAAAVWAEAFAALSSRLDQMARAHAEESARLTDLVNETREAVEAVPAALRDVVAALAPATAVSSLREALDEHMSEVRPKVLGLFEETARQRDAAGAVRELVEAVDGRVAALGSSLEQRIASVEAALARLETGDRLDEVRRETLEVKRLVESRLEEARGQSRRLTGFLKRALEELEPPEKD